MGGRQSHDILVKLELQTAEQRGEDRKGLKLYKCDCIHSMWIVCFFRHWLHLLQPENVGFIDSIVLANSFVN